MAKANGEELFYVLSSPLQDLYGFHSPTIAPLISHSRRGTHLAILKDFELAIHPAHIKSTSL